MTISPAMQEYLAETYRLAQYQDDHFVSTSSLADVLSVSAPAVTRMVQRLKASGYLEHEPYQGVRLTDTGEREALLSIRRHRLVERFLVDVMGFGWHEVHDTADELGETVGERVVTKMEIMAGFPKRCPHGEPIPTADGVMPEVIDYPLTDVEVEQDYVVSRANSHDGELLKYLNQLGLRTGKTLRLAGRAPFDGPLQIAVDTDNHFIGHAVAQVIRVCSQEEFDLV